VHRTHANSRLCGQTAAEVLAARRRESVPVYDELLAWVATHRPYEPPASLLGKAMQYLENHRVALRRYLEDGRIPIDNNDTLTNWCTAVVVYGAGDRGTPGAHISHASGLRTGGFRHDFSQNRSQSRLGS